VMTFSEGEIRADDHAITFSEWEITGDDWAMTFSKGRSEEMIV
jgi:hypothetical protein